MSNPNQVYPGQEKTQGQTQKVIYVVGIEGIAGNGKLWGRAFECQQEIPRHKIWRLIDEAKFSRECKDMGIIETTNYKVVIRHMNFVIAIMNQGES